MSLSKKTDEALAAGARIKAAREALHLSLAELSRTVDGILSASRIGNYEQGTREIDISGAKVLGNALDAHPAYLMGLLSDEEHGFLKALEQQKKPKKKGPLPFRIVPPADPRPRTKRP